MTATNQGKIYFVGGINGVGKTTLLGAIVKKQKEFQAIKGSQYFMQWLGIKPGDYASLRSLPDNYKNKEMDKMVHWLIAQKSITNKHLLFDAHYLNIKEDTIMVTATGNWIALMDALVVVTANNDEILHRIEIDQLSHKRIRPIFKNCQNMTQKLKLIDSYQAKTLHTAKILAKKYCLPLVEIKNNDKQINMAINQFPPVY